MRRCCSLLWILFLLAPVPSQAQLDPAMPEDLQRTYGAFAAAMVTEDADRATEVDGVVVREDGVALAGRCTSPAGSSGIYSNAWKRQVDASWNLALSVRDFESSERTPAHCGPDEGGRVVSNVSGAARSPRAWANAMDSVGELVRSKFPAVRETVMQPVVRAPEGTCDDVRAGGNHPHIVEGIRRAGNRDEMAAGPSPRVAGCDQLRDSLEDLTKSGPEHERRSLRDHYRPSTVRPERDEPSSELLVYTTLRPANLDIYVVDSLGAEPERITDNPGLDYNATFSPDGRWLVYTSERSGNADLYALDLERGGDPVRLTRDPAMDDAADVSPDGERLVFVSTREGNADVFAMPFAPGDTTAEARAENLTDRPEGDFNPAVSPDGSEIAWARGVGGRITDLHVMDVDGSDARRLTDFRDLGQASGGPAWSRSGSHLYFHTWRDRGGIRRIRPDGSGLETVVRGPLLLSPTVGPAGRIVFHRDPRPADGGPDDHEGTLHSVLPDGTDLRQEVDSAGPELCLAPAYDEVGRLACHGPGPIDDTPVMANRRPLSRPGTHRTVSLPDRELRVMGVRGYFPDFLPNERLAYGEWLTVQEDLDEYGTSPLVTSRPDGAARRVTIRREGRLLWGTATCGDGSWIAFNQGPTFAPADTDVDIWKVRPDGEGATNLTPDSDANDAFPAWSPDCRTLAFRSGRSGDKEIYLMDADGGNVRRLTHREGVETVPDLSPDGAWITFATDRGGAGMKVWVQRLDGSGGRFLEPDRADEPGIDMHPRFSPDGEWIVFVSDRGGRSDEHILTADPQPYGDIWAVPFEGGDAVRLTDDKWEDGLPRWGLHGRP